MATRPHEMKHRCQCTPAMGVSPTDKPFAIPLLCLEPVGPSTFIVIGSGCTEAASKGRDLEPCVPRLYVYCLAGGSRRAKPMTSVLGPLVALRKCYSTYARPASYCQGQLWIPATLAALSSKWQSAARSSQVGPVHAPSPKERRR